MCGCRKFVRTCSLFSRRDFNSSQSSGFVDFCSPQAVRGDFSCFQFVLLFTAIILFLLRVQDDCQVFLDFLADSLLFPASICCNSLFFICFTFSALRKSSLNKSFKGVPQQGVGGTQQKEHAQNRNRTTTGGMRENPYTQVRINKKNYRLLSCFIYFLACETAIIPNIYRTAKVYT